MLFSPVIEHREAETSNAVRNLVQRLSVTQGGHAARIIAFIASRPHEGTSTIVRQYADMLASETERKVLVIDAGTAKPKQLKHQADAVGIVDALLSVKEVNSVIHSKGNGVCTARWLGNENNRSAATKVAHDDAAWKILLHSFDAIIIDAPSLQTSFDGVILAAKADAAVLVVEAEKTPEPVIKNLRDTLLASGAKIAGVVMNKRRHYIPDKIYNHL